MSDMTNNLPLRAWQFDSIPATDPKTHAQIDVDLPALVQEIDNLRLENLQHPKQALEANNQERFELKKRVSEENKQKYTLVDQIRLNVKSHQREALRKLAHLNEDDYLIPLFPCEVNTPQGQATRCFSSSHHVYGITSSVTLSEQSNQTAAIYFPVGEGEVEDAYNNNQSDHAARWMADYQDRHGDPVQAERMRERIGVMTSLLPLALVATLPLLNACNDSLSESSTPYYTTVFQCSLKDSDTGWCFATPSPSYARRTM